MHSPGGTPRAHRDTRCDGLKERNRKNTGGGGGVMSDPNAPPSGPPDPQGTALANKLASVD